MTDCECCSTPGELVAASALLVDAFSVTDTLFVGDPVKADVIFADKLSEITVEALEKPEVVVLGADELFDVLDADGLAEVGSLLTDGFAEELVT